VELFEIIEVKSQGPVFYNYSVDIDDPPIETQFLYFNDGITLNLFISFLPKQVDNVTIAQMKVIT
jgi:hypothetical protein